MIEHTLLRIAAAITDRLPFMGRWIFIIYRLLLLPRFSIGVLSIVFDDAGRVLLVEHRFHPQNPWGLPGGGLNRNEEPSDTAVRELREELNAAVHVVQHVTVRQSTMYRHHLTVFVLADFDDPHQRDKLQLSLELKNYGWFDPDAMPASVHESITEVILQARDSLQSNITINR